MNGLFQGPSSATGTRMRLRKIAITGFTLTALSLAALVIIEMRFAEAVIGTAYGGFFGNGLTGLSSEIPHHRDASLILSLFSLTALAATAALLVT